MMVSGGAGIVVSLILSVCIEAYPNCHVSVVAGLENEGIVPLQ